MIEADRRTLIEAMLVSGLVAAPAGAALAQSNSLTDIGAALQSSNTATIYVAKEIITMDDDNPTAEAVAVADGKILGVGSLEDMRSLLTGKQEYTIDRSMADKVVVPGFIAQHDHPLLAALTMSSDILSIEDWELPTGTVKALKDKDDFVTRLTAIVAAKTDPNETILSWGYHEAFYGKLTRDELDAISDTQPIVIWGRSCHEFFLNSRALELSSIDEEFVSGLSESEKEQSNLPDGHFFEQGSFAILPKIAPLIVTADRFRAGLLIMRDFMHAKGITIGNEPGGVLSRAVQDGVNAVMSDASMPFRWEFMPDGKTLVTTYGDKASVLAEIEKLKSWYSGNTRMAPGSVKLFADGAIYSLLMQTRAPYLDGHEGAWMTDLELFENAFKMFWDEGFQIHIHVNGDAGLDRVLNTLEKNMARKPREDHRTVIVHFAVSAFDQVQKIADLGAIVSGNPYYVAALSDQYSEVGLGPERARSMVRLGDLSRAGISWSLHSDMPMAPGDPLFLMWCAVNRLTTSGLVSDASQKVTAKEALAGVTSAAAYSWMMEDEIGTIAPGYRANLTVLDQNPLTVDPMDIRNITVLGTMMEGRVMPVGTFDAQAAGKRGQDVLALAFNRQETAKETLHHAMSVSHSHDHGGEDGHDHGDHHHHG